MVSNGLSVGELNASNDAYHINFDLCHDPYTDNGRIFAIQNKTKTIISICKHLSATLNNPNM